MKTKWIIKNGIFLIVSLLLLLGCSQGNKEQLPSNFVWDREVCEECKMAVSDPHYAAQVIDPKGKPHYFDDIGCLVFWLKKHPMQDKERSWVNDFKTTEWIDVKKANWKYGDPRTPMGYGFAATLSEVENAVNFETVTEWMLSGKNLANKNKKKHHAGKKMDNHKVGNHKMKKE
ncbi:MAG: hypothetical protein GY699_05420 [Desulfobacteraceae bacterium]|nr:hypothetical protein [Desulfobacteraceae bacterium]